MTPINKYATGYIRGVDHRYSFERDAVEIILRIEVPRYNTRGDAENEELWKAFLRQAGSQFSRIAIAPVYDGGHGLVEEPAKIPHEEARSTDFGT